MFTTHEVPKKGQQSTNSGLKQNIDISTYQYQYVKCRGAHCKDFGAPSIGAKPNLYCEAIELVCGGSPIGCGLVERKAQDRVKWEG